MKENKYIYDLQHFQMIRFYGENLNQKQKKVGTKRDTYETVNALYKGQELTLNDFKYEIFPIKSTQGKRLKRLTVKQISLTQVKAGIHLQYY